MGLDSTHVLNYKPNKNIVLPISDVRYLRSAEFHTALLFRCTYILKHVFGIPSAKIPTYDEIIFSLPEKLVRRYSAYMLRKEEPICSWKFIDRQIRHELISIFISPKHSQTQFSALRMRGSKHTLDDSLANLSSAYERLCSRRSAYQDEMDYQSWTHWLVNLTQVAYPHVFVHYYLEMPIDFLMVTDPTKTYNAMKTRVGREMSELRSIIGNHEGEIIRLPYFYIAKRVPRVEPFVDLMPEYYSKPEYKKALQVLDPFVYVP